MTTSPAAGLIVPPSTTEPTVTWKFCRGLCRIFTSAWTDLKVYETHNVPPTGGALLAPNHLSYLDPVLVGVQLRRPITFMARDSLFRNPVFGGLIRRLHSFPVRRGEGDVTAVRHSIALLKSGHLLNMFPEGTRSPDGNPQPILPGVALVIRRAGVPVIPVLIEGSYQAWPRGAPFPRRKPITVRYGRPLLLSPLPADQIIRAIDSAWDAMRRS